MHAIPFVLALGWMAFRGASPVWRSCLRARVAWLGVLCCLLAQPGLDARPAVPRENAFAGQDAPPGFYLLAASIGVALYQGDVDFVQVVDLRRGASIRPFHGGIANSGSGQGVYGGDNPDIWRYPLWQAWDEFVASNKAAFCITNGQFFSSTQENPTPLTFPLKQDGVVVSEGYGLDKYVEQQLMLEIWRDRAEIAPLTRVALYASSAPSIVAGLTEDAGDRTQLSTGRTFVGIGDGDGDGRYERVLIFNSEAATAPHAAEVLRGFGAAELIMLDGGDSTQLICQGVPHLESKSDRAIPQVLATARGPWALAPPFPLLACLAAHLVRPDETLSSIACRHATTAQTLAYANGLSNPNVIFPGQVLCIP